MQNSSIAQEKESRERDPSLASREQMVQISRRIDWRFLLPEGSLGRVGCFAPANKDLLTALQYFSDSLTIFSSHEPGDAGMGNVELFDLAVIPATAITALEAVKTMLKPGGYLYWEVRRSNRRKGGSKGAKKSFSRLAHVRRYAEYLRGLGFDDVAIHWHRPGFANCKEFIPLPALRPEENAALRYAFSRGQSGLAGRLKLLVGRMALNSGLLPRLAPCFSVAARKT